MAIYTTTSKEKPIPGNYYFFLRHWANKTELVKGKLINWLEDDEDDSRFYRIYVLDGPENTATTTLSDTKEEMLKIAWDYLNFQVNDLNHRFVGIFDSPVTIKAK